MDASEAGKNGDDPAALYSGELRVLEAAQAAEQSRERQLGYAKIGVALFTLIAAVILLRLAAYLEFLLLPVALFVVLAVWHEKRLQSIRSRKRAILFYERGLARIENRWKEPEKPGSDFSIRCIRTRVIWIYSAEHLSSSCSALPARAPAKRLWRHGC